MYLIVKIVIIIISVSWLIFFIIIIYVLSVFGKIKLCMLGTVVNMTSKIEANKAKCGSVFSATAEMMSFNNNNY